ncbi:MAG TPA: PDZ domain-containing protein [Candidatus Xenobia bacterium]|jgi:membrane-associated protease RseP (regulator of RpoE activity)
MHRLILILALGAALSTGGRADTPVAIQVPNAVTAQQAFPVQVRVNGETTGTVTLSVLADPPGSVTLGGTVQAALVGGTADFPGVLLSGSGTFRLTAVAVEGNQSESGVSAPMTLSAATYPESGGIGVDLVAEKGQFVVSATVPGLPAATAGAQAGDVLVEVDGKPTAGMDDAALGAVLKGPVGSRVVVTVRHKGSSQTQDLAMVRVPTHPASMQFVTIPSQMDDGAFQVSVKILDGNERPLPGADVAFYLSSGDPKPVHVMLFLTFVGKAVLKDGSGTPVDAIHATTGLDGVATAWVRIASNFSPYQARLGATVQWQGQSMGSFESNVFPVDTPDSN